MSSASASSAPVVVIPRPPPSSYLRLDFPKLPYPLRYDNDYCRDARELIFLLRNTEFIKAIDDFEARLNRAAAENANTSILKLLPYTSFFVFLTQLSRDQVKVWENICCCGSALSFLRYAFTYSLNSYTTLSQIEIAYDNLLTRLHVFLRDVLAYYQHLNPAPEWYPVMQQAEQELRVHEAHMHALYQNNALREFDAEWSFLEDEETRSITEMLLNPRK